MSDLPRGTVTFLLTDIEGSTRLWEQEPDAMSVAVARHDVLLTAAIEGEGGTVIRSRGEGDSFFAVFDRATDAVAAALALQRALVLEAWPTSVPIRVRAGMNTGEAELRDGDYYGTAINRCARLRAIGSGGQTLLSQATCELVAGTLPPGAVLRDLGRHRLKDLQRPEQVFELLHPDLPSDFPPLKSLEALPNNLPLQTTRFIGREGALAGLRELLAPGSRHDQRPTTNDQRPTIREPGAGSRGPGANRLVTLTGMGGCGKTRLSVQVAADLLEEYPDGVWFVELAALADPALVPDAVAAVVGVREEPGRPLTETLAENLRDRRVLLILDNCEHLIGACATLANTLLRHATQLRILATSREVLGVVGEVVWPVPPLGLPEGDGPRTTDHRPPTTDHGSSVPTVVGGRWSVVGSEATRSQEPEHLLGYESVDLFVDRARLAQPRFTLTGANAGVVAQVCRRLDGIPLALELAAARVRMLTVEQIAARLDDRFRLLTGGSRTALPRQQTLRALIDWSYDLLSEPERVLFRRLSVFAGGWTLEAAEGICAEPVDSYQLTVDSRKTDPSSLSTVNCQLSTGDILDLLSQLVDKSLVLVDEGERESRYRLLETIRQYGAEKLRVEGGEAEAVELATRHRDWFLAFAVEADRGLHGPEQAEWLDRLESEHDNLRAALRWSIERQEVEAGLRLGASLWRFWSIRGHLSEGRERLAELLALERALEAGAESAERRAARASALNGAGALAYHQGDYAGAGKLYEESLQIRRELGDRSGVAASLNNLGLMAYEQGDHSAAQALLEESLALRRELGDRTGIAASLSNLGLVADTQREYARARLLHEESLTIRRQLGDQRAVALSLNNLGWVAASLGETATARALHEESLAIRRELGDRPGIAASLNNLGNLALEEGEYEAARALYEECLEIERELGNQHGIATALGNLGRIAQRTGEYRRARELYEESLAISRAHGHTRGIDTWLMNLARVLHLLGEREAAGRSCAEALGISHGLGDRANVAECLEIVALAREATEDPRKSVHLLGAAAAARRSIGVELPASEREAYDQRIAALRDAMGEAEFDAAWAEGEAMPLEALIEEAS
jgi:predicted ATPase/class 3 adenylate cyclase